MKNCPSPLVVVEMGAGTAIFTIRNLSENLGRVKGAAVMEGETCSRKRCCWNYRNMVKLGLCS